jgi:hypothetical protein
MYAQIERPDAFRRSYTLTYAVVGNLAIAIIVGLLTRSGILVDSIVDLWNMSPLLPLFVVATIFFVIRANIMRFGNNAPFSKGECVLSALVTLGIAAVIWVIAFLLLSAMGADFT